MNTEGTKNNFITTEELKDLFVVELLPTADYIGSAYFCYLKDPRSGSWFMAERGDMRARHILARFGAMALRNMERQHFHKWPM